jgi:hypothetical protein
MEVAMHIGMRHPRSGNSQFTLVRAALLCFCVVCMVLPCAFSQTATTPQKPSNQAEPKPPTLPETSRLPNANDIMKMREDKVAKEKFKAANTERKRQLDEDSLALLTLAAEVNDNVAQTGHSAQPDLLRKMQEIERLAHNVQVKMKLTMSAQF